MNNIPAQGLHHVTVVVVDARATAQKYASVHGTTEWKVRRYDAARLRDATTHGFFPNHEYLTATGVEVAQSASHEKFLDFYYLDTRRALAGYVTEVPVPGSNFAKGRPNVPFAMVAGLSRPVPSEHAVTSMAR